MISGFSCIGTVWLKVLNVFSDIIIHNSLRFSLNISTFYDKIGHKVPYTCAKFKRNRSTGRVFLVGSKLLLWNGAKKKKKVKKMEQFSGTHILRTTGSISFKFICRVVYMEGIKICKFDRSRPSCYRDTRGWIWQVSGSCK